MGACVVHGADAAPAPAKSMVALLGVGAQSLTPQECQDLGLAEGMGLVVRLVAEQSPAQNRINVGDVLVRLDDQLLIHPYQLAVLVRTYKPGTEVRVRLLRGGNEMDVPVVLGECEARPLPDPGWPPPPRQGPPIIRYATVPAAAAETVTIDVVGAGDQPGAAQGATVVTHSVASESRRTATRVENGTTYMLTSVNGTATFTVTGPDATVLFRGTVTTDPERARVPEAYQAVLTALLPAPLAVAPPAPPAPPPTGPPPR